MSALPVDPSYMYQSEFIYEKITKNQPIRICEVTAADIGDGDGAFFAQVNLKLKKYNFKITFRMHHVTQVNSIQD